MERLFFDPAGRLRSGWRFLVFLTLFIVIIVPVSQATIAGLGAAGIETGTPSRTVRLITSVLALGVALFSGWTCGRFLEGLPFRALGAWFTKGWLRDLLYGIGIGAFCIALAVGAGVLAGGFEFVPSTAFASAVAGALMESFAIFLVAAAFEEALVRGYMFQTFVRSRLAWLAILLTSLFFAAGHMGNPSAGFFSTMNTALAGVWLGIAYLKTRTLWLPLGLHFSWNWIQGSVFGIEVSGLTNLAGAPMLVEVDKGPVWLTGGSYGLEGGILGTLALAASMLIVWFAPFLKPEEGMLALSSGNVDDESRDK